MSRAILVLSTDAIRQKALEWVQKAPEGTRLWFKGPKRTLAQNDRLWAALTDVASQATHNGRKYPSEVWKVLFMDACGREIQFVPKLDGAGFLPMGHSSSDLSKEEMSELLAFIEAWGAENGIVFHTKA